MKQVGPHCLIKAVDDLPEPKDNIVIGHVAFVGSVAHPVLDINGLFPTDDHFQLTG